MLHSYFSNENRQQQQQQEQQPPPWSCPPPPQQQQQDDASSWRLCLEAARSILEHDMAAAGAAPLDHMPNTTNTRTEPDVYMVPCRARGLSPLEHNIKNANLIVPKDAVHGQNLYCTNPVCRNGGVRFRYCATCQVPAARRNFSTRHSHGRKASACSSAPKKATATPTAPQTTTTTTTSRPLKKRPLVVVCKDNNNTKKNKTVPSTQLQDWKRLLHQRPSDLTNRSKMEEWFQEILLVSAPTQENDDNDTNDDDQQFQATMEATRRLMRLASKAADSAAASVCREEGCSSSMMESD